MVPTPVMTDEKNGKWIFLSWEEESQVLEVGGVEQMRRLCWGKTGPEGKEKQSVCVGKFRDWMQAHDYLDPGKSCA